MTSSKHRVDAARITRAGKSVACQLSRRLPSVVDLDRVARIASLLCRQEPAYARIQDAWCSDERACNHAPLRRKIEAREAQIEAHVRALVALLPATQHGPIGVQFDGDPRGPVIRLLAPTDATGRIDEIAIIGGGK